MTVTSSRTEAVSAEGLPDAGKPHGLRLRAAGVVRAHPWATVVAAVAVVVRVVALIAYRPIFEFHGDSYHYLANARHLGVDIWHPLGYAVFLRVLSWTGSLTVVSVVQHVLGLATGLLVYRFVRDRGVGDAGAALAAAPVLLDAWQVFVEHTVITEALFEFLVALAVVLLTRPAVSRAAAVWGGLVLAAATLTRTVGLFIAIVLLAYLLARRVGWRVVAGAAVAVVIPLVGYAAAFDVRTGTFGLQGYSGRYLYGETATFANCRAVATSPTDRLLCPRLPRDMRPGSNSYVWADDSPVWLLHINNSVKLSTTAGAFAQKVIRHQPLSYARYVAANTLHYFTVGRVQGPRDYTAATWQFPALTSPPPVWHIVVAETGFNAGPVHPSLVRGPAHLLRGYQRVAFTPGPALALALLFGLVGAWLARRTRLGLDLLMLSVTAVVILVTTSASAGFDYRYVLPTLLFLPPAGVIGATLAWRARPRRAGTRTTGLLGVAVIAMALVGTNLLTTNVIPAGRESAKTTHAVGSAVRLPGGLDVRVSDLAITGVRCAPPAPGPLPSTERRFDRPTTEWRFAMHVTVVDTGAAARLVQSWNLATRTPTGWTPMWAYAYGGYLRDAVVSPKHRRVEGNVFAWLPMTHPVVSYTDPTGAGAAAWRLDATPPAGAPTAGSVCTPAAPA